MEKQAEPGCQFEFALLLCVQTGMISDILPSYGGTLAYERRSVAAMMVEWGSATALELSEEYVDIRVLVYVKVSSQV